MIKINKYNYQFKNILPKQVTRILLVAFVFIIGISEIANATTRTSTATGKWIFRILEFLAITGRARPDWLDPDTRRMKN